MRLRSNKRISESDSPITNDVHNNKVKESNSVNCMNNDREKLQQEEQRERRKLLLWRRPICTLQYFLLETLTLFQVTIHRLYLRKKLVSFVVLLVLLCLGVYVIDGVHTKFIVIAQKHVLWWSYWVGLGILSSVGLGTGLHTFLLYLGPHIASVTLAAYECQSVDFPEPPYPDEIICPTGAPPTVITLWTIISKVRWEAVMWGAGTAIGELPPYFMARAARLSGQDDDDEFEEIEELLDEKATHPSDLSVLERAKLAVHSLVQRVGFFGILACASIPNPLFDLAGITCGHFLIPFWTFFGATLIGKSIIKMHIQKLFVIFVFSEHHVELVVKSLKFIPYFGPSLQIPFKNWLTVQKSKLHHTPGQGSPQGGSLLSWIFEKVIIIMVVYFVLSIINSMAQRYHKRLCKQKREHIKS